MPASRSALSVPTAALGVLLALWIVLGAWICFSAPFGSGTDESIRYVAFAAARNRWATPEDAAHFGIDHYYYPPLYYLLFAPFFGDEPAFTSGYPLSALDFKHRVRFHGGRQLVRPEALSRVPGELLRLYRTAKVVSLLFGIGVIVCVAAALRRLFTGPDRDWLVLGGTAPLLLLPQFLYYQTLVNNDSLLNFLGALALVFFIAAACSHGRGEETAARRQGIACAAAVGLGLLTKQSAVVLTPLLPALAYLQFRHGTQPSGRTPLAGAVRRLALLSLVGFAAGGWWLLRSALAGDISGLKTQALAHPWAFVRNSLSLTHFSGVFGGLVRTYIAHFAADIYSIPDGVFLGYLAVASALFVAFVCAGLLRLHRHRRGAAAGQRGGPRRLVWGVLAAVVALNLGMIFFYNTRIVAPHGRLLFLSLVAGHALFTAGIQAVAGGDRRRLAALVGALVVCLGGLFLWTFRYRMVPAVLQPDERLVMLGIITGNDQTHRATKPYPIHPLWGKKLGQPLCLPPGRITGFRTPIAYVSHLPQFGTVIHARLRTLGAGSETGEHDFTPRDVGSGNGRDCWTDLVLEKPVDLREPTAALLLLEAEKPWFMFPGLDFGYSLVPLGASPLLKPLVVDGRAVAGFGLAITAVYERLDPDALRQSLASPCATR